jgi:hypothetical protein
VALDKNTVGVPNTKPWTTLEEDYIGFFVTGSKMYQLKQTSFTS